MPSCFSVLLHKLHRKRKAEPRESTAIAQPPANAQPQLVDINAKAPPATGSVRLETPSTAKNTFVFALETLSTISSNIPFGSVLNSVLGPLLNIIDRVQETAENKEGFLELAARVHRLEPIIQDKKANEPACKEIVEALGKELKSIQVDIEKALQQGTIASFFNSQDNASGIVKHNEKLAQLLAESMQESLVEVQKILREVKDELKARITKTGELSLVPIEQRPILKGGQGGAGGKGKRGGSGGLGKATNLNVGDALNFRSIEGGIGGVGGEGIDQGGDGGVGEASQLT